MSARNMIIKLAAAAIAAATLMSCGQSQIKARLSDIESYINERPDSALAALRAIDTLDLRTRAEKAKFSLLHAMALDKNYIDTADTRVVQPAVDYYSRHGSPEERLKAFMYMGTIYHNLKDYRQAIVSFYKAEESILEDTDKNLVGVLYSKMAETYTMTEDYAQAEEYIDKSILCFSECGRKDQENLERHVKARMLIRQKKWDAAGDYLLSLMSDTTFSSNIAGAIEADYAMYILYDPRKDDSLALEHFQKAIAINGGLENYDFYYAYAYSLGVAGNTTGEAELLAALPHKSPSERFSYDYWRHRQLKERGDFKSAYYSLWLAKEYSDSVSREKINQSAAIAQKAFLENKIKEQHLIYLRRKALIIILLVISSTLLLAGSLYVVWKKRRQQQEDGRKDLIIDSLKEEICNLQRENEGFEDRRITRTRYHFKYLSRLFESLHVMERSGKYLSADKLFELITEQTKLLGKDIGAQKEFERVLNLDTDGLMEEFREGFPLLKDEEYRLASLVFAGFDNTIITLIMDISSLENTRVKKSRLKKKIKESKVKGKGRFLRFFE